MLMRKKRQLSVKYMERYASGETKAEIVKDLQRRRVKTSLGNEFTYNSLSRLLKNKRYIGIYLYK